jgi:hypothetical protein
VLVGDVDLQWGVSVFYCHVCHTTGIGMKGNKEPLSLHSGYDVKHGACDSLAPLTPSHTSVNTFCVKCLFVT